MGGYDGSKDLIYLIPRTGHFKTAGGNLSGDSFALGPDGTILTAPGALLGSGSSKGSTDRLPAYPIISKNYKVVDRNDSVWLGLWNKPGLFRLPKDSLSDDDNPADSTRF